VLAISCGNYRIWLRNDPCGLCQLAEQRHFCPRLGACQTNTVSTASVTVIGPLWQTMVHTVQIPSFYLKRTGYRAGELNRLHQKRVMKLITTKQVAVRIAIILLALAMAFEQLGIAKTVIVATFSITLGGVVLALAIAFGLGARDSAKDFIEKRLKKERETKEEDFSHL